MPASGQNLDRYVAKDEPDEDDGSPELDEDAAAVIASRADTLLPEAFEQGGPLVALSTALGFVLSFLLATV